MCPDLREIYKLHVRPLSRSIIFRFVGGIHLYVELTCLDDLAEQANELAGGLRQGFALGLNPAKLQQDIVVLDEIRPIGPWGH